jgi:hypothetical protein
MSNSSLNNSKDLEAELEAQFEMNEIMDALEDTAVEEVPKKKKEISKNTAWPLNEAELDAAAQTKGWDKLECAKILPMASFGRGPDRLLFWLSEGTVGVFQELDNGGRTRIVRFPGQTMTSALELLDNPEAAVAGAPPPVSPPTGPPVGSSKAPPPPSGMGVCIPVPSPMASGGSGRGPCRFGAGCTRPGCWFDHGPRGSSSGPTTPPPIANNSNSGGGGRGPCRFGAACTRPGCWFTHPGR